MNNRPTDLLRTDPRGGHPSASSWYRYLRCPGAYALERAATLLGATATEREADPAAVRGTRLHAAVRGAQVDLEPDDLAAVERMQQTRDMLLESVVGMERTEVVEERCWLLDREGQPVLSGQPDLLAISADGTRALLVEYKTGDVTASERLDWYRDQLTALLACAYSPHLVAVRRVSAVVIPASGAEPYYGLRQEPYNQDEVLDLVRSVRRCARELLLPGNGRNAGAHCRYCPALVVCDTAHSQMRALVRLAEAEGQLPLTRETVQQQVARLGNERLSDLLQAAELAQWLIDAAKAEAKQRLQQQPDAVPGWKLSAPTVMRRLQAEPLLRWAEANALATEPLLRRASWTAAAVREWLAEVMPDKTDRERHAVAAKILADCAAAVPREPQLLRANS